MDINTELLNFIYQNSGMGNSTITQLLEIVKDTQFSQQLNIQLKGYNEFHTKAKEYLNKLGHDEKRLSAFEKIRTYLMISMQTMADKSPSHIAEMMIIGSNMGIVDAIKKLKEYNSADPKYLRLMEELLEFEENNVQCLKKYL